MHTRISIRLNALFLSRAVSLRQCRTTLIRMASNETNKDEEAIENDQIVNIETVVAADNKGIDYEKLISKYEG